MSKCIESDARAKIGYDTLMCRKGKLTITVCGRFTVGRRLFISPDLSSWQTSSWPFNLTEKRLLRRVLLKKF